MEFHRATSSQKHKNAVRAPFDEDLAPGRSSGVTGAFPLRRRGVRVIAAKSSVPEDTPLQHLVRGEGADYVSMSAVTSRVTGEWTSSVALRAH
jgi:hypothetical protein